MTESDFEDYLLNLFDNTSDGANGEEFYLWDEPEVVRSSTFEDSGVLTRNSGLVVRTRDGSEFQLTIVKSQ